MNENYFDAFIENAIKEDIRDGDHSTLSCIPPDANGKAKLLIKQEGVLAGVYVAGKIMHKFDPELKMSVHLFDGAKVKPGDIAFIAEGSVRSILQIERLVLNVMQRMSGIATRTNEYVSKLEGLNTRILDTRKTTPGMRFLEKQAVVIGGGANHRMGLYDMIMLKDNHIDFAGGIEKAIDSVKKYLAGKNLDLKIEIETRSLDDIKRVLAHGGVNRIMLDNFDPEMTREAVKLIDGKYETESSGGITLETIRSYAECGVDFISVGALTHQISSLDMSLKAIDF
ncbi:MAG: nicotinate-nucleotide diphosphorylase (carboxylating) [Bacteroidetes bacterium GWF2_38_335]|nr:MAG: nicotinate-nucleotide diphosphorylase (carboxylating) [Bacteroidetes bacterium GWF2_38_335]OFY80035.1 MAG: nicotinate-nucleotide diphosphorylase (carboxylating) [Bacteroidetes bacterium RIFOXYA12_FULL_38_20]HBS85227.1 carboxylating nicotinate-nucleotide diphosphorylase [Bacteroidales bacterium]